MKKSSIFILSAIIMIFALTTLLTACDGNVNINLFGTSKYTVEIESSVESVPNYTEITEEYVQSIISVQLKWNDGSTTKVSFDDCKLTFKVNDDKTKLDIKVKFGKKSDKLTLDIVEQERPYEKYGVVSQEKMVLEGATNAQIMAAIAVYVNVSDDEDPILIDADGYTIIERTETEDHMSTSFKVFVEEYMLMIDGVEINYGYNPALLFEGETNIEKDMTAQEVQNVLKVYIQGVNNEKIYLDYTCTITFNEEENNTTVTVYTEGNGFTDYNFSNAKYPGAVVDFDESRWQKDMTDEEIIDRLIVSYLNREYDLVPLELGESRRPKRS